MIESLINKIKSTGLSYQQYYDLTKSEVELENPGSLTEEQKKKYEDRKLNLHRMTRIEKHYLISDDLKELVGKIISPQTWMIISETWCGDSAQNIPVIAKAVESNPNITLKLVLRDSNPDIMNLYLTNGMRSIPILVVFDENVNELFRWGPRPEEAKKIITDLKAQGYEKQYILEKLHLWYGRNRAKNLENELMALMNLKVSDSRTNLLKVQLRL